MNEPVDNLVCRCKLPFRDINHGAQLTGSAVIAAVAVVSGLVAGQVIALSANRVVPYVDGEEFALEKDAGEEFAAGRCC